MEGKDHTEKLKATEQEKPKECPPLLHPNQIIAGSTGSRFLIESLLARSGFSELYKVSAWKDSEKKFAMKVEPKVFDERFKMALRLKAQIHVFNEIKQACDSVVDKTHFVKVYDKGKTETFKYYVMDLTWLSLKDCVQNICNGVLSSHAKIIIARQTLKSIEALHKLGFLHTDIKRGNFAVGLPPKDNIIYCIDFGMARAYRDKDGGVLPPRARVPFIGTLLYASVASLELREQGRRDDLECWMYMMIELYCKDNLPWRKKGTNMIALRKYLMDNPGQLAAAGSIKIPARYVSIIRQIGAMSYGEGGNFKQINQYLDEIVAVEKIDESLPLDWVGKWQKWHERQMRDEKKQRKKESRKQGDDGSTTDHDFPEAVVIENKPSVVAGENSEDRRDREEYFRREVERQRKNREYDIRKRNQRRQAKERRDKEKTDKRNRKKKSRELRDAKKVADGAVMEKEGKIEDKEARSAKKAESDEKKEGDKPPESEMVEMEKPAEVKENKEEDKEKDRKSGEEDKADSITGMPNDSATTEPESEKEPATKK